MIVQRVNCTVAVAGMRRGHLRHRSECVTRCRAEEGETGRERERWTKLVLVAPPSLWLAARAQERADGDARQHELPIQTRFGEEKMKCFSQSAIF